MTLSPHSSHFLIPNPAELKTLLEIEESNPNYEVLFSSLLNPLSEFLCSSGKQFRTEIIEIGFLFAQDQENYQKSEAQIQRLHVCAQIIEGLHAGSMIIDDIQDQSLVRRGKEALHRKYGVGIALNAGNWLYFQALDQIRKLAFEPRPETHLRQHINQILLKAHFGQALDIGASMTHLSQGQVKSLCMTAIELKTGALMALGFDLGAFIATEGALPSPNGSLFAKKVGACFQMFDDIGNFTSLSSKGKEDLKNARPSFLWAIASEISSAEEYAQFIQAVQALPEEHLIQSWATRFQLVARSKSSASESLWNTFHSFHCTNQLKDRIRELFRKLESSYV